MIKNEINKKSISETVLIILSGFITYKYGISSCVKIFQEEEIEKSIHNHMIKEEDSRITHIEKKNLWPIFWNMLSYIRIMKMLFYISCTMFISLKSWCTRALDEIWNCRFSEIHPIHNLADKMWSHIRILALKAKGLSGYDVTSMVGIKAATLKSTHKKVNLRKLGNQMYLLQNH